MCLGLFVGSEDLWEERREQHSELEGNGAAWDWFYPYHYAPLASDLHKYAGGLGKLATAVVRVDDGGGKARGGGQWAAQHGPVQPFVQLMAVLPPQRCAARRRNYWLNWANSLSSRMLASPKLSSSITTPTSLFRHAQLAADASGMVRARP